MDALHPRCSPEMPHLRNVSSRTVDTFAGHGKHLRLRFPATLHRRAQPVQFLRQTPGALLAICASRLRRKSTTRRRTIDEQDADQD